jgi:acetyl esterase/lipase
MTAMPESRERPPACTKLGDGPRDSRAEAGMSVPFHTRSVAALLGDSAGGALAGATAQAVRGAARPALLFLINPMTSPAARDDASMRDFARGFFAGAEDFAAGWDAYRGAAGFGALGNLLAQEDLSGLPPTIILTHEADPVRDQGERLAEKLPAAGVVARSLRTRGLIHAAWLFPKAQLLLDVIAGALRMAWGPRPCA